MATAKTTQVIECVSQEEYDDCKTSVAASIAQSGINYIQQNDDQNLKVTVIFPDKEL